MSIAMSSTPPLTVPTLLRGPYREARNIATVRTVTWRARWWVWVGLLCLGTAARVAGKPVSLEWSVDGRYVVAASDRGQAVRVSTSGMSARVPAEPLHSVRLSPEGRLALGVMDETFVSVDLQSKEIVEVPLDERLGKPVSWHRGPFGDVVVTKTVAHYNIRRSGGRSTDADAAPTQNFRALWLDPTEPLAYLDTGYGLEVRHLRSGLTLRSFDAGLRDQRYLGAVRDPHGRLILGVEDDSGFRIWTPPDPPGSPWGDLPIESVKALSGDGLMLAVGTATTLKLYATATQEQISLLAVRSPIRQLAFAPDSAHLAVALDNGSVRVYPTSSQGLPLPLDRPISEVDVGRIRSESIGRGELPLREPVASWQLSGATVYLSWTPEGLLSGWVGGRATQVDPSNGDELPLPLVGVAPGKPYALSSDGSQLAAVVDGGVGIFDTRRWRQLRRLPTGGSHQQLEWRGQVLVMDAGPARAQSWNPKDGLPLGDAYVVAPEVTARFRLSPDGQHLAVTGRAPRVVRASDGVQVTSLSGQWSGVIAATWSSDGRRLATAGGDATVLVWDTATWTPISLIEGLYGRAMAFSPDSTKLVSASWEGAVIANVADGVLEQKLAFEGLLSSVDWSEAGVALVDSTGSLYLWPR
jgi:WD40 repeat protein